MNTLTTQRPNLLELTPTEPDALVVPFAVLVGMALFVGGVGPMGALLAASFAIASAAAFVDARSGLLPNRLVLASAVPVALAALAVALRGDSLAGVPIGALLLAGPMFVTHVVSPASLGFGDVKLGVVLGAGLGLVDARLALLALCLATAITLAVAVVRRRNELPLGPGLVLGATGVLLAAELTEWETLLWR